MSLQLANMEPHLPIARNALSVLETDHYSLIYLNAKHVLRTAWLVEIDYSQKLVIYILAQL